MKAHGLTIYKASAGSGKTHTLALDYIKLALLDRWAFQKILAITFTVKATQEMKERIMLILLQLSQDENKGVANQILDDERFKNIYDEKWLKKRASEVHANILHNYSRFEIYTLDSFFVGIVKSMAKEIPGLPVNFDLELDSKKVMETIVRELFATAKEDPALLHWLESYAKSKMLEDKSWQIKRDIHKDGMQALNDKYRSANTDKHTYANLKERVKEISKTRWALEAEMKKTGLAIMDLIQSNNLSVSDFKAHTINQIPNKVLKGNFDLASTLYKLLDGDGNWYKTTQTKDKVALIESISDQLKTECKKITALIPKWNSYKAVSEKIFVYGVLDAINRLLKSYRTNKNLFLLGDMGALLAKIIQDNDAPFILEKVGSRYEHIFVDEFQDTSDTQWKNILPLIKNALSEGGKAMIVGDVKQSIYRWRGGNLNLLLTQIKNDLQGHTIRDEGLRTSYRSTRSIVDFNNVIFDWAKNHLNTLANNNTNELYLKAYDEHRQSVNRDDLGYVEIKFIPQSNKAFTEEMIPWVVDRIESVVSDGYELRDILILVETHAKAREISLALMDMNLAVVTDRSLLLRNSEKVLLLISVLKWMSNSQDEIAKVQILYLYDLLFPTGLNQEEILDVSHESWPERFDSNIPPEFKAASEQWKLKPIYEAVEEMLIFFGLHEKADAFTQRFQDSILSIMDSGVNSLSETLDWWEANRNDLSIKISESQNAIKVSTVHKVKGLSSPIVIFPYSDKTYSSKGTFWTSEITDDFKDFNILPLAFGSTLGQSDFVEAHEKELSESVLERINVHYVAFTRAEDRLYIVANPKPPGKDSRASLGHLLKKATKEGGFSEKLNVTNSEDLFTLGKTERKVKKNKEVASQTVIDKHLIASPYRDKIQLRKYSKKFWELREKGIESKRRHGLIVHDLLERLQSEQDVEVKMLEMYNEGLIDESDFEELRSNLEGLSSQDLFKSFFADDWEVFVERDIFFENRSYRPDRVITKEEKAIVIDYKREVKDKKHEKQVQLYEKLLRDIGYTDVKKYLVFTQTNEIIEV